MFIDPYEKVQNPAHNPKVVGSNPAPATSFFIFKPLFYKGFLLSAGRFFLNQKFHLTSSSNLVKNQRFILIYWSVVYRKYFFTI